MVHSLKLYCSFAAVLRLTSHDRALSVYKVEDWSTNKNPPRYTLVSFSSSAKACKMVTHITKDASLISLPVISNEML